jgi:hypothetical protein
LAGELNEAGRHETTRQTLRRLAASVPRKQARTHEGLGKYATYRTPAVRLGNCCSIHLSYGGAFRLR